MSKTWSITGATRGMGTEFAKAALAAGHNVVATGRRVGVLNQALGSAENLLTVAMDVTRAVLPIMRAQRFGHVITISSTAGLVGYEFVSAYCAAKFAVEGWMESLQPEVEPYGITTTIVNPGSFRTELLTKEPTSYADPSIGDYAERTAAQQAWWTGQNGKQSGDPASCRVPSQSTKESTSA